MTLLGAVALLLPLRLGFATLISRLAPALAVTVSFGLIAWGLRAVTRSGAVAGAVVTLVIFLAMGMDGFLVVLLVFVVTFLATRIGYAQKERLGLIQSDGRNAGQVLANLAAAAISCGPAIFFPHVRFVLFAGACAALAEAAADTASSEVGQAFRSPAYLITNLVRVPSGQNGAISIVGTVAGVSAAFLISFASVSLQLVPAKWLPIVATCGAAGMFFDSILGATLESPERLDNNSVNFVSTVFSAFFAILFAFLLW